MSSSRRHQRRTFEKFFSVTGELKINYITGISIFQITKIKLPNNTIIKIYIILIILQKKKKKK